MSEEKKLTRKEQAEATKRLVFETALRLLDEKPFEDIKIRTIAEEAGVSIGTFYNYFDTKWDVYYETYKIADDYFENDIRNNLPDGTCEEQIYYFFNHYAGYSSDHTSLKLTQILYNSANHCFNRESDIGMRPLLLDILKRGIENGEVWTDESAEEIADFLMVCVRGQVYDWCTRDGAYNLRDAVLKQVKKLWNLYRKP